MAEWAATFKIRLTEPDTEMKATFTESDTEMKTTFQDVYYVDPHPVPPPYEGPYVAVPKTVEQILPTKRKTMLDDVTVTEIPYAEVGNVYGTTVTIASS